MYNTTHIMMLTEDLLKQYFCVVSVCFLLFKVNPELTHFFEDKGLRFVGHDTEGKRMEVIELRGKTWFLQCLIYTHPPYLRESNVPLNIIL